VGTAGSFPRGKNGRGVKLTTYLHLVPKVRIVGLYLHSPICLHGIVLNYTNLSLYIYIYIEHYIIVPDFMARRDSCCNKELVIHSKISNSHSVPPKPIFLVNYYFKIKCNSDVTA
jgi:hypothetical protein